MLSMHHQEIAMTDLEDIDEVLKRTSFERVWALARLHYKDRAKRGTPAERKAAGQLRATALNTAKAAQLFGMSVQQFNRTVTFCDFEKRVNGSSALERFWFPQRFMLGARWSHRSSGLYGDEKRSIYFL